MPWIPRDLLEPAQVAETIGNVEAMDHFLTHNPTIQNGETPDSEPRWGDVLQYSNDMLQSVVGQTLEEFDIKGYERETAPRILLDEDVWFIPSHIIRLYDAILLRLEDESLAPPKLLPRLTSLRDEPLRPLLNENQRVEKSAQHLGYMEWRHPLSASQREAVDHFLTLSDGEILAINGPPGTGKTTLLQSVVASLWVEAALHEREPPVIFASSSNNQAVTNVIDSFGDVPEDKESLLRGRWIPELESYGLFCPSSSRAQEALNRRYQITTSWPNPSGFLLPPSSEKWTGGNIEDEALWTGGNIEDEAFISLAEQYFLKRCRAYMKDCGVVNVADIKGSVRLLHRQLEEKTKAICQGIQTWLQVERIQAELSERYGAHGGIEKHLNQCASDLETCQKKIVQYREAQCGWLDHVDTVISFFKQLVKDAENQEQGFAEKLRQAGRDWRDHADTILSFFDGLVKDVRNQEWVFAEKLRQIQTELSDRYGGGRVGIETHLNQCASDLETCQKKIVQYREAQCGWLDHVDTVISFFKQLVKDAENQEQGFAEKLRQAGRDWRDHADTILSFFDGLVKDVRNQEWVFAEKLRQIQTELSDRYGRRGGIETHLNQCASDLETCQKKIVQYREAQCGWLDHVDTMPWWMTLFGFLPWVKGRIEIRNRRYLLSIRSTCLVDPVDIKGITDFFDERVKDVWNQERDFAERLRQVERDWQDHADTILLFFEQLVKNTRNQERGFIEKLRQVERDWRDYADTILSFFDERVKYARNQERVFAEKLRQAERDWRRLQRAKQAWGAWCAQHGFSTDSSSRSSLLDTMDMRLRYTAFKLATHYWEGRWLLEMREQFNTGYKESQSEKKQKKRWRRYAKLAPCFVSTLYTLPNLMHAFNGKHVTLFDFIDLLIIDEGGQVAPDISGATFALAKKALVVGDTQQLEPIWSIPKSIDIGNLREKKVIINNHEDEIEAFFSTGLDASSGSLMKVAQRASPYQKSDERGSFERGMFLAEHRRCVPEIIQYCNQLAYGGRLIPMRKSEVDHPWPHLGYAHISGQSRRVTGSRENQDEAIVIVRWIAEHHDMLVSHYSEKSLNLDKIVAIVTPFRSQANLLQRLLKKSGITEPLKVGTVHILQGAECPVVIFSPVYGIDDRPPYFFDRGNSMLNVAVSRAQDSFLVFGNMNNFDQEASSKPSGILASFLFRDEANEITQAASVRDRLPG